MNGGLQDIDTNLSGAFTREVKRDRSVTERKVRY